MFDPTSRYYRTETAVMTVADSDGAPRVLTYIRRRIIPPAEDATTIVEHQVMQGERLDVITARYLSDPTLFWQVCDVNNVLMPNELTDTVGRMIKIALPMM